MKDIQTVILCGGQGTRIRSVAADLPKPMIPVGNHPILWHIMKYYATWDVSNFVLCLGYKGDVIRDYFLNYEAHTRDFTVNLGKKNSIEYHNFHQELDWNITMAETGLDSMTGARVKNIQRYISGDDFMLTYGDGVGDINIEKLFAYHKSHGKILTVTGVRPPSRFGELHADEQGLVDEFNEKPQAMAGRISGGYFVCKKEIFNYLNDASDLVFEQAPMRNLAKDGQMMMYRHDGFWQPMDTYREYIYLNKLVETNKAPWMLWNKNHYKESLQESLSS